VTGIYLLAINHFIDCASRGTNLEQDSHFPIVIDDVWIVHTKLSISTLKHIFGVDSVTQLPGESSDFCHLLGTIEEENQVRFSGLYDSEPGQL
jgi:hypothetical protein